MEEDTASKIQRLKDWNGLLLLVVAVLLIIIWLHPNHTVMPTSKFNDKIEKTRREAKEEQMDALFGTDERLQQTMVCAMWGLWWNDTLDPSLKQWFEAMYDTSRVETTCTDAGDPGPEFAG